MRVACAHMQDLSLGAAKAAEAPLPTGRLLTYSDIAPQLKGRQAEVRPASSCALTLLPAASGDFDRTPCLLGPKG